MRSARTIAAILFIVLLSSSIMSAAASIGIQHKTTKHPHHDKHETEISDAELREKAEHAIDEASRALKEARELLAKAEEMGVSTSMMQDLLKGAEEALKQAKKLLNDSPEKALSMARRAEALARMLIEWVKKFLKRIQVISINTTSIQETESKVKELKKILGNFTRTAREVHRRVENLTVRNADIKKIEEILDRVFKLINETLSSIDEGRIPSNIDETLEKIRSLLEKAEEILQSIPSSLTTATKTKQETNTTITAKSMNMTSLKTNATKTKCSGCGKTFTSNSTRRRVTITKTMMKTKIFNKTSTMKSATSIKEINITIQNKKGMEIKIEQLMTREKMDGNLSIIKEMLMSTGNKTLIRISKELSTENRSKVVKEFLIEKNETVVGALLGISRRNSSTIKIDSRLNVTILKVEKNKVRFKIEAPNGTPGRILIIQLTPDAVELNKIKELKVFVNGKPAVLASSILDLASEVYEEPAYVFIISSKGASILLYIPHFSSYTVDILGILEKIQEVLSDALNKILTRDILAISTIMATAIAFAAALMQLRRKETLYKI